MHAGRLIFAICIFALMPHLPAQADSPPGDAIINLITAAKAGDVEGVKKFYTPSAWEGIAPVLPSTRNLDDATEIKRNASQIDGVEIIEQSIHGDSATVMILFHHQRYDERVRIALAKGADGWQITDTRPIFFFDGWPTTFKAWELAYLRAKQAARVQDQYRLILKGVDYENAALADRCDDISAACGIGQIYFDRLGSGGFADPVRTDTLGRPDFAEVHHPTVLSPDGSLLPELTKADPQHPQLKNAVPGVEAVDGAPLQYLRPYDKPADEGFPYGVPPFALAFNYYKRAQVLHETTGIEHTDLSNLILESRPALALRSWAIEEQQLARKAEQDHFKNHTSARESLFEYKRSGRLAADSLAEYDRILTLPEIKDRALAYSSYMLELRTIAAADDADFGFIEWSQATPAEKMKLNAPLKDKLQKVEDLQYQYLVAYYVQRDDVAFPKHADGKPLSIDELKSCDPKQLRASFRAFKASMEKQAKLHPGIDFLAEDRAASELDIQRSDERLELIIGEKQSGR